MSTSKLFSRLLIACSVLIGGAANATSLVLPSLNPFAAGTYDDFRVYSLDLLNQCSAASNVNCLPYVADSNGNVQSGVGQIKDLAVVLSHAVHSNYDTPFSVSDPVNNVFDAVTGGVNNAFTMGDAGGTFTGDLANRWDIKLSLLQGYLGVHDLVFLFDNNQQANGTYQNINIWGQARIVDAASNTISCFQISAGSSGCNTVNPLLTDYLQIVTGFCVSNATGDAYAPTNGNCHEGDYLINNNLSTSIAEFAAFNKALNDAAKNISNGDYFLSLNVKYNGDNAGAEQLWICDECDIGARRQVPEPAPLALIAIALLGLGLVRSRANKQN